MSVDALPGSSSGDDSFEILIAQAATDAERIERVAWWILREFDVYYRGSRHIPELAKEAFERCDHPTSLELSRTRLSMYSVSIVELGERLKTLLPVMAESEALWDRLTDQYLPLIEGRYEADLAFAYLNSVSRSVFRDEWTPVAYSFHDEGEPEPEGSDAARGGVSVHRRYEVDGLPGPELVGSILDLPVFMAGYRDRDADARAVAQRIAAAIPRRGANPVRVHAVEVIDAGFYRNRGGYLVGRILLQGGERMPLVIALLNDADGIYVDAVLTTEADAHNIFSSTLANFHVTNSHYHELARFLHTLMPKRPLGLHYSTIGFNHVGKVAVMNELAAEIESTGQVFSTAVGFRGTVAIGFSTPSSAYNLKVIRDRPTAGYKWGEFPGVEAVLRKYARVHEINRTGSMLDNIIYHNLKLDRRWFDEELLAELLEDVSGAVSLVDGAVVFRHLIVQRRQTPLPVYLESAGEDEAVEAVINLGYCIKNNAAANIFNRDLDARNYGVSRHRKVYLYDYDALEPFTEVKIRSNADRIDGEEDLPDWYFEDGVVFLPEEIESGLRLGDRELRRVFREHHGDLLTVDYWERIQADLLDGKVPEIRIYPESAKIR